MHIAHIENKIKIKWKENLQQTCWTTQRSVTFSINKKMWNTFFEFSNFYYRSKTIAYRCLIQTIIHSIKELRRKRMKHAFTVAWHTWYTHRIAKGKEKKTLKHIRYSITQKFIRHRGNFASFFHPFFFSLIHYGQ